LIGTGKHAISRLQSVKKGRLTGELHNDRHDFCGIDRHCLDLALAVKPMIVQGAGFMLDKSIGPISRIPIRRMDRLLSITRTHQEQCKRYGGLLESIFPHVCPCLLVVPVLQVCMTECVIAIF
jgi:hypothetical protein